MSGQGGLGAEPFEPLIDLDRRRSLSLHSSVRGVCRLFLEQNKKLKSTRLTVLTIRWII